MGKKKWTQCYGWTRDSQHTSHRRERKCYTHVNPLAFPTWVTPSRISWSLVDSQCRETHWTSSCPCPPPQSPESGMGGCFYRTGAGLRGLMGKLLPRHPGGKRIAHGVSDIGPRGPAAFTMWDSCHVPPRVASWVQVLVCFVGHMLATWGESAAHPHPRPQYWAHTL